MSCLDEEREIEREDTAIGLYWDRKRKRCYVAKSGDRTVRQHARFLLQHRKYNKASNKYVNHDPHKYSVQFGSRSLPTEVEVAPVEADHEQFRWATIECTPHQ